MLSLKLTLLGSPRLEREGQTLPLGRRKSLALLAYLAVTGQPQQRDHLLAFFWPDYAPSGARNNLRRELSVLKKTLGAGYLTTNRTQVTLNPSKSFWLDVHQFRELLAVASTHDHGDGPLCADCARDLTTAVSLYPADFMAGFGLPNAPAFDDWLFFERESLRQGLAGTLRALISHHSSQGEYEPGISYARRWLALDPLHEPAHRTLMQLYAWSGQQTAALRQYEECVRLLKEELGISPEPETKSLYEAIKAKRLHAPPAAWEPGNKFAPSTVKGEARERSPSQSLTPSPSQLVPPSSPAFLDEETATTSADSTVFVGREAELAQLSIFLDKALAGQAGVAFVTGEAGQGKTSLLNAFARQAQETHNNLIVARGVCDVYTGVGDPFLPFRDILSMLTGDVESQWRAGVIGRDHALRLWRLLPQTVQALTEHGPDLIDTFVPANALLNRCHDYGADTTDWLASLEQIIKRKEVTGGQQPDQNRIFEQVTTVLTSLAAQKPLLLIIDDLHWADLSSISLLAHLGRRLATHPILIIGAYRPEDVAQGREAKPHPLQIVLSEFKRQMGDVWIDLDRSQLDEARAFVDALLDTEPNRLGEGFRQALTEHTRGQPLFTIELLREMEARGALQQDETGFWLEGEALNLAVLPPRVEGVIERRIGRLDDDLCEMLTVASVEGELFTAEIVAKALGLDERNLVRQLNSVLDRQHHLVKGAGNERIGGQRLSRYRFRHNLYQTFLYYSLADAERMYWHEIVGTELEGLFGERLREAIGGPAQLARHFEQAGLVEKAIDYLLEAGNQAIRLAANEEAVGHLSRGLMLLKSLPETPERDKQELGLQLALGNALIVVKDYVAGEVHQAYARARVLSEQLEEPEWLFPVFWGLWMHYATVANHKTALELAEQLLALAQKREDMSLFPLAHRVTGMTFQMAAEFNRAWSHFERGFAAYEPRYHQTYVLLYGEDPGVTCGSFGAYVLAILGYPDQAVRLSEEVLGLAQEMAHPMSLAIALHYAAVLHMQLRDWPRALEWDEQAISFMEKHDISLHWSRAAVLVHGYLLTMLGRGEEGTQEMQGVLAAFRASGDSGTLVNCLMLLAHCHREMLQYEESLSLLAEAQELIDNQAGPAFYAAWIYRLQGELLLVKGVDVVKVEACFQKSIEVARQQQAKLYEVQAVMSLSRLWLSQGKKEEARQLLAEIYGWFTEGFGTADLQEAKALLESLAS
jgi:adenylate cyclase